MEELTDVLGLRTSGAAWREFLYKGEPLQTIRERLEELERAGLYVVEVRSVRARLSVLLLLGS